MAYVLTLLVFSAGNVTIASVDYNSAQTCEAARAQSQAFRAVSSDTKVVATCTAK